MWLVTLTFVCVFVRARLAVKDKAAVQLELEQLQQAHQELTEQVTELTEELEKERSRGHALRAELDKLKVRSIVGYPAIL